MKTPDQKAGSEHEQQCPSQSPNWDKYKDWPSGAFINEGFPFDEGWPSGGPYGNQDVMYEVITRDGVRHDAKVDYTTQYRSEGLQWRTNKGETLYKEVVVAWRRKE
jgi:hypothetical protein